MLTVDTIKQAIRSIFTTHNNARVQSSIVIEETVDLLLKGNNRLHYYETRQMVINTLTDGVFDQWLDFHPRNGIMIMRHDDIEEPCPSTQPYSCCPPTQPSMPNQPGVSCEPKDTKQGFVDLIKDDIKQYEDQAARHSKATRQDIRAVRAEKPCKNCTRMNDLGVKKCWWCDCQSPTT